MGVCFKQQPKQWILKLLAISCVSLAAKMNKIEFSLNDFQVKMYSFSQSMYVQVIKSMDLILCVFLFWYSSMVL